MGDSSRGRPRRPVRSAIALVLVGTLALGACGDDDASSTADEAPSSTAEDTTTTTTGSSTTTEAGEVLRVVLVNDDGLANPAIDVLVGLLTAEPDVEVTVVAPAEERSGSSDTVTEGEVGHTPSTTPGGAEGYAVDGYPADAVVVALDELDLDPHLVVSGINPGQNIGPFAALSGTVGAGRTAIRRGVPALAVSGPFELDEEQFGFAAGLALDWIRLHRDDLLAGTAQTDTVTSINVPDCPVDAMGPLQDVPLAAAVPEGVDPFGSSCDQADPSPGDDVSALVAGYPARTAVPAEL